jgi:ABC-type nitrate/sulfonate/bicarbonate transport system ATPase subunit
MEFHNLSVWRDGTLAVDGASLFVQRGEIVSLVGPSGAGKSSLLLAIAGLVRYEGSLIAPNRIGVVFQDHAVFPWLTVEGNIRFGLCGLSARERDGRVEEVLDISGISGLRGRYPAQLSGGERQRVAIARTLAARPGLLLLDEPFASLDVLTRVKLADWLRQLTSQLRIAVLMVSHDLGEAVRGADRIAVMVNGRITALLAKDDPGRSDAELHDLILHLMGRLDPPMERVTLC